MDQTDRTEPHCKWLGGGVDNSDISDTTKTRGKNYNSGRMF